MTDSIPEDDDQRATANLAGIAMALFLLVIGVFLGQKLVDFRKLDDCYLSGAPSCGPLSMSVQRYTATAARLR